MNEPSYRPRSKRKMESAMYWALNKLGIAHWTVTLWLDHPKEHPRYTWTEEQLGTCNGRIVFRACDEWALIIVRRQMCKLRDTDPLMDLFHECAHCLLAELDEAVSDSPMWKQAHEKAANRVARVLYALWIAEDNK